MSPAENHKGYRGEGYSGLALIMGWGEGTPTLVNRSGVTAFDVIAPPNAHSAYVALLIVPIAPIAFV